MQKKKSLKFAHIYKKFTVVLHQRTTKKKIHVYSSKTKKEKKKKYINLILLNVYKDEKIHTKPTWTEPKTNRSSKTLKDEFTKAIPDVTKQVKIMTLMARQGEADTMFSEAMQHVNKNVSQGPEIRASFRQIRMITDK